MLRDRFPFLSGPLPADTRGPRAYAVAFAMALLALALTIILRPVVERNMLAVFVAAVGAAAWYGGLRAGMAATAFTTVAGAVLLFSPAYSLNDNTAADAAALAVTAALGTFISWLVHRLGEQLRATAASEVRFRELVEGATDYALYSLDERGRILTWNEGAARLHGYSEAEAVGRPLSILYPEGDQAAADAMLARARAGGRHAAEGWRVRKDGSRFWAGVLVSAQRDGAGNPAGFTKVTRDLSERRRAEQELAEREARLASIVATATDAIISTGEDRRILLFNAAAESMFGVTAEEALGGTLDRFIPPRHRENHARQITAFGRTGDSTRSMHGSRGALPALRADGSEFPVEATISTSVVGGQRLFTAVLRDVTERARAEDERERLISELEATSRAKSEFLATMSHELRTPINAIVGYSDLMELGIGGELTETQTGYLRRIRASSQHLRGLIDDVLDMARVEAGRLQVRVDEEPLSPVVREATELVAPQAATRNVRLADADVHPVCYRGDGDRVRQVLVNLLGNAVKFTPPGGTISIRSIVNARRPPGTGLGAGPWVGVEVRDTGIGIPADELERIFEPFTQVDHVYTREQGGTGLGLAISRRLARRMGGDLTARSEPGKGSCFTLWLPAVASPELVETSEEPGAWPMRPGEVPGLAELGRVMAERADEMVRCWADRLESDPLLPSARGLDRAQLENHVGTVIVELAKELVSLDEGGGEPSLMRDGTDIQILIAERHGEQRARLGWSHQEVEREYDLLREEVARLVSDAPAETGANRQAALAILDRLLRRAGQVSLVEHDRAR